MYIFFPFNCNSSSMIITHMLFLFLLTESLERAWFVLTKQLLSGMPLTKYNNQVFSVHIEILTVYCGFS